MCHLTEQFERIEARALSCLRNVSPERGTVHDYRNILLPYERAIRALNTAYTALNKADNALRQIAYEQ